MRRPFAGEPSGKQLPEAVGPPSVSALAPQIHLVRLELRERGVNVDHVTDLALGYVVQATNSVGLAADAIAMSPRPSWVEEFIGVAA